MNYKIIDMESYYRKHLFKHFSKDCKCSLSITNSIDVTKLYDYSKRSGTKFYINFLYVLSKTLNSRMDYKLSWKWETQELIEYEKINPIQYIFHDDTETFTISYTEYFEDYHKFYENAAADIERAKATREYGLDSANHPNWFDASCIPWISYDSLNIELPDGYLYFNPIINWGRYRCENGHLMMPLTVRLNHAVADGFLVANVFRLLENEIEEFSRL